MLIKRKNRADNRACVIKIVLREHRRGQQGERQDVSARIFVGKAEEIPH